MKLLIVVAVLSGALAAAQPGCLERVQERRITNGWGLTEPARPGVVLIAIRDCSKLGLDGSIVVEGRGRHRVLPARVVDCQQVGHKPLESLGLAADVNLQWLNGRRATVIIWEAE